MGVLESSGREARVPCEGDLVSALLVASSPMAPVLTVSSMSTWTSGALGEPSGADNSLLSVCVCVG